MKKIKLLSTPFKELGTSSKIIRVLLIVFILSFLLIIAKKLILGDWEQGVASDIKNIPWAGKYLEGLKADGNINYMQHTTFIRPFAISYIVYGSTNKKNFEDFVGEDNYNYLPFEHIPIPLDIKLEWFRRNFSYYLKRLPIDTKSISEISDGDLCLERDLDEKDTHITVRGVFYKKLGTFELIPASPGTF